MYVYHMYCTCIYPTQVNTMSKLLVGGFLTSTAYLSFKFYNYLHPQDPKTDSNYQILRKMEEYYHQGHLQDTPFPPHLEIQASRISVPKRPKSLCESIQLQFEKDWNHFLYQISKIILK